jgi:hypothetical protein
VPTLDLILGGPLPFFLALLIGGTLARGGAPLRGALAGALALALGYLPLHLRLEGLPLPTAVDNLSAISAWEWLGWLLPLGAASGYWLRLGSATWLRFAVRLAVVAAVVLAVVYPKIKGFWDTGTSAEVTGLGAIAVLLGWWSLDRGAARASALPLGVLAISALCASVAFGLTGSVVLAQLGGAVAAATGALAFLALLAERKGEPSWWASGAVAPAWIGLVVLTASAYFYSETPWHIALLLAATPLLVGPSMRLGPQSLKADSLRLLVLAIPPVVGLVLAYLGYEPNPYADEYG